MRRKLLIGLVILFVVIVGIVVGLALVKPSTGNNPDNSLSPAQQTEVFGEMFLSIQQTQTATAK